MAGFKEGRGPLRQEAKDKQPTWQMDELIDTLYGQEEPMPVVIDGKLANLYMLDSENWRDPQKVALVSADGNDREITTHQALDLLNTTDPQELRELLDAQYDGMPQDENDPTVVHDGHCWRSKGDIPTHYGTCSGCGKYWGASIKSTSCTCGKGVRLT